LSLGFYHEAQIFGVGLGRLITVLNPSLFIGLSVSKDTQKVSMKYHAVFEKKQLIKFWR